MDGELPSRTTFSLTNNIGYSIRVPKTSVDAVGLESIPLNDGSGDVWVSMNIYHHLHCLVSMYYNFESIQSADEYQDSIRHQVAGTGCKASDQELPPDYFPPHIGMAVRSGLDRLQFVLT